MHAFAMYVVFAGLHLFVSWWRGPSIKYPTHVLDYGGAFAGGLEDGQTQVLERPENMRRGKR